MTRRRGIPCWAWAVPVVLALVALVTWIPGKAIIDRDLERKATAALAARGVTGVSVDVEWARGVLRGPPALEQPALNALRVGGAGPLRSVRYVADGGDGGASATPGPAPSVGVGVATTVAGGTTSSVSLAETAASVRAVAEVSGNRVALSGTVPTAGVRASLVGAASAAFGATRVDDRLTVVDGAVPSSAVLAAVDRFATLVTAAGPRLSRGTLSIVDTAISATGSGFNGRATTELGEAVAQADGNGITASGTFQAVPADRATLQAQLSSLLGRSGINFASGSAEIDAASRAVLDTAAASIQALPTVRIAVNGHTDDEGAADANRELSRRRAEAVVAYLARQGVAGTQLTAAGYGADQPIADNGTAEGRAANRRIEFAVIGS